MRGLYEISRALGLLDMFFPDPGGDFIEAPKGPQPRKIIGTRIADKRPSPKEKSAALKKLLRGKGRK